MSVILKYLSSQIDEQGTLDLHSLVCTFLRELPLCTEVLDLDLRFMGIHSMRAFPPRLKILNLNYNPIEELIGLPLGLEELYLVGCKLYLLRGLPAGLKTLTASGDHLVEVVLPAGLQNLDLRGSQITSLRDLPAGLQTLNLRLGNGQLTSDFINAVIAHVLRNPAMQSVSFYTNTWEQQQALDRALKAQPTKRLLLALVSPAVVKRLGTRSVMRRLPLVLARKLSTML